MGIITVFDTFYNERSFPFSLKAGVFFSSLFIYMFFAFFYLNGSISPEEARLTAYSFFIIIFCVTFFCGFKAGILLTVLSSLLVIRIFIPQNTPFHSLSPRELEGFPFLALYFLVAVTVDWFRNNYEDLKKQNERNRQLYEQAQQLDKLALAGEIAAGIAHEIRNPLTVVHGYVQLLALKKIEEGNRQEIFSLILDEIMRTNKILNDFLHLSRPAKPNRTIINLQQVVGAATSLISGEALRNNVTIHSEADPHLPSICLDREQIMQVLLNLLTNAIQAMPDGGTLSVVCVYNRGKKQVELTISDNGHGIAEDLLSQIFTPFFTTRENGTGLGLAITQSIVLAHDGGISVESKPGEGSRFLLSFPVDQECDYFANAKYGTADIK